MMSEPCLGPPAKAVPIRRCRIGPGERAGVHGAGRSCSLRGPDRSSVLFFFFYQPLSFWAILEYICHILVPSGVGKYFLPVLL